MPNTFFGLSIGKKGLYAYQAALNTTAHNASNIDTEGYTRQQTNRTAEVPLSLTSKYGMIGSGVVVSSITSIRDAYFDTKYRFNNAILADNNTKAYYLDTIQSYFSEVNAEGVSAGLDSMFTALSGLSNDVGNTTIRTELTSTSKTFAESLNYLYDSLQTTQRELNQEIKTIAGQINAYAEEIASITRQINTVEVRGDNANDLRDKRELLVDKLSEFANVSTTELETDYSVAQYIVKIDGAVLVDTYEYFTLEVTAKETSVNQNDVEGLYELKWSSGQGFGSGSPTLGGKLQSLFELRDGNNNKNFNGKTQLAGDATEIVVTGANIQSIAELNIPNEDGLLSVGSKQYEYDSFEIKNVNGEYQYIFKLKEPLKATDATNGEVDIKIGEEVSYKGIPYYMEQINQFARTFAKSFNDIHKEGKDLYGKCEQLDFFTGTYAGTGEELKLSEVDQNATKPLDTYYGLTAGNIKVKNALLEDVKKIASALKDPNPNDPNINTDTGLEDNTIIRQLSELQNDVTMFKQGTPSSFLESFIAVLGVAGKEANTFLERQEAIVANAEQQRYSVSGVDQDEEAMDLVKFKNAYDLCSKVISVMNEIYDKLINQTGL